jgi:hypothetical protein
MLVTVFGIVIEVKRSQLKNTELLILFTLHTVPDIITLDRIVVSGNKLAFDAADTFAVLSAFLVYVIPLDEKVVDIYYIIYI